MNLNIPLSPDTEAKLREQALASGKDIDTFVLEAIQRTLSLTVAQPTPADDPFLGLLADDPELADSISESAMRVRETRPLRTTGG